MATTRSFSAMLNEYLPTSLFMEELVKRDWFFQNVDVDQKWKGGQVIVPFYGARASSVEWGQLPDESDVSESNPVRGTISSYKEAWGTLKFNATDFMQHDGRINEDSFLRILPDEINAFMSYFKQVAGQNVLTGNHFATLTADGDTGGTGYMTVDKIDRFQIGQKFYLDDGNSSPVALYVIAINVNTNVVTVSDSRGGSAFSISGYTTAQTAKCYHPGAQASSFTNLKDVLLSAANGGGSTVHGQTKATYPILQAVNVSGASITKTNVLEYIFNAYTTVRTKAKGNASVVLMSYKHMGSIMKLIENRNGQYSAPKQPNASIYGWTELEVVSVKGTLKCVAIQEMDDDVIMLLDMKSFTFRTNGGFRRMKYPDGNEYYVKRATTGVSFYLDHCLFGELEVRAPGHNAIIYGITAYAD